MVNPFPFGNTNGIIDMVTLGLVGVCKTGAEVHEHIDEGLFKRLGLPEWLIANTADEYVECAIRLAENHDERLALRRHIIKNNGLQKLFTGDPRPMGRELLKRVQQWAEQAGVTLTLQTQIDVEEEKKPAAKKSTAKRASTKKTADKKETPLKTAAKKLKKTAKNKE